MPLFWIRKLRCRELLSHSGRARVWRENCFDPQVHSLTCSFPAEIIVKLFFGEKWDWFLIFTQEDHFLVLNIFFCLFYCIFLNILYFINIFQIFSGQGFFESQHFNEHFKKTNQKTKPAPQSRNITSSPKVKVAQSFLTLCDPVNYIVHGIFQVRILQWIAFPFSRESSQPRDWTQVFHIAGGFFTTWVKREAQEYWSGKPIPSPAHLPDLGNTGGPLQYSWASLVAQLVKNPPAVWDIGKLFKRNVSDFKKQ